MKIHLCCGDIYLKDYVNIDTYGDLVEVCPDNPNVTTLDKYYRKEIYSFQRPIVDRLMKLPDGWDYPDESIDEVLMICAIEHLSKIDAEKLRDKIYPSLKKGGKWIFDFPDLQKTFEENRSNHEKFIRLTYGSGKNDFAFHRWGYTSSTIREFLNVHHWQSIKFGDIVKHQYPMIGITAEKW